ncbi:MAG: hypothetical protein IPM85_18265 [Chitinophagaceae bacterium]|nr:hypothetical protein [Chitinophagaceae bacterium]
MRRIQGFIIALFLLLSFYSCSNSNKPTKTQAKKAIEQSFNMLKFEWLGPNRSYEGRVEVHDLKGFEEGVIKTVILGRSPDEDKSEELKSGEKGQYVALATLFYKEEMFGEKLSEDTVGAIFVLVKKDKNWFAFPGSRMGKIKQQ